MAPQPGKKVKQGIETLLTTSQNLQKQKDQPLTNVLAPVSQNVQQATQQATQQTQQAKKKIEEQVDPTKMSEIVKVDQTSYNPATAPKPVKGFSLQGEQRAQTPQEAVTTHVTGTPGIEGILGLPETLKGAQEASRVADVATIDSLKGTLATQVSATRAAKEGQLAGIEKALAESTGRVTDSEGNIIGSNVSLGQVAPMSALETQALTRDQALAAQDPTSNLDALATLLGVNYDPRLAGLSSQIYQRDVARERGAAAQRAEDQKSAEAGRTMALEDYLQTVEKGQKDTAEARTKLGENIDTFVKSAEKDISDYEKLLETKRGSEAQQARLNVANKTTEAFGKAYNDGYAALRAGDVEGAKRAAEDLKKLKGLYESLGLPWKGDSTIRELESGITKKQDVGSQAGSWAQQHAGKIGVSRERVETAYHQAISEGIDPANKGALESRVNKILEKDILNNILPRWMQRK